MFAATRLGCLGNHRLQNMSYMPDVTLQFHNADVMGSTAENILQSMQTHCSTCSVAPPIETASQLHFGCAPKYQSPGCGTGRTYNTYYSLRSVSTVPCSTKCSPRFLAKRALIAVSNSPAAHYCLCTCSAAPRISNHAHSKPSCVGEADNRFAFLALYGVRSPSQDAMLAAWPSTR